jgi:hypothetical protein
MRLRGEQGLHTLPEAVDGMELALIASGVKYTPKMA